MLSIDNNSVYWIRRVNHIDISSEGYVGVSCDVPTRVSQHTNNNTIVGKALRKYTDITVEVIKSHLSIKEALQIERDLRPSELMGWNICKGGGAPRSQKGISKKHTKQGLSGENRTEYQKAADFKKSLIMSGRTSPNLGKSMSEEQKQKISCKTKGIAKGPHSKERIYKLSIAAKKRPKILCPGCGLLASKATLARHHKGCSDVI